jgi:hypothetical protein
MHNIENSENLTQNDVIARKTPSALDVTDSAKSLI